MPPRQRPSWWNWEFDFNLPHLRKRMLDRSFKEAELRLVLEHADDIRENHEPGRWVIAGQHAGAFWEVVVKPLYDQRMVLVITAYRVSA